MSSSVRQDKCSPVSREAASQNTHAQAFTLLHQVCPHGAVLDIPCGSGAFTWRLRDAGYQVTGADLVPHPAAPQECLREANMNEVLPFEDGSFDAVVSIEGIEHLTRPFDFVRECRRVLRPGGVLILTTPNISSLRSRWRWFLTGFHNKCKHPLDETHPQPRHHINMLSYPELRYMFHTSALRIEQVHTNRIKGISWMYAPLTPLTYATACLAFAREVEGARHARVTAEVLRTMHSVPVLFGETLILQARAQ
ncbi:MAG: class I SAM-dependent methyltransferase [Candidatus Hydrogenedentes bacterium]|nr:class I SAM-dependent methyltransferase [Candidatus Hydrogenedentota bacterium]